MWLVARLVQESPLHFVGPELHSGTCRALVVTSESTHVVLRLYLGQLVGWLVDVTIQKPC